MIVLPKESYRISGDRVTAACSALIGATALVASLKIPILQGSGLGGYVGPQAFPITISSLLILLSLILYFRSPKITETTPESIGDRKTLVVTSIAILSYLVAFGILGFVATTALFLFAMFIFLGERRIWVAGLIACILALLIGWLFSSGLNVALPSGIFGF